MGIWKRVRCWFIRWISCVIQGQSSFLFLKHELREIKDDHSLNVCKRWVLSRRTLIGWETGINPETFTPTGFKKAGTDGGSFVITANRTSDKDTPNDVQIFPSRTLSSGDGPFFQAKLPHVDVSDFPPGVTVRKISKIGMSPTHVLKESSCTM